MKYEENEHSLEMHISMIKQTFHGKDFTLVPLMVGFVEKDLDKYGQALQPYWEDEKTLFVVSTDFCHWGSRFRY